MENSLLYYLFFFLNKMFYPAVLLTGIIICWKYRFKGGVYFFLLMLINQIYSFIHPSIAQHIIQKQIDFQKMHYSIWISQIYAIVESVIIICAFLILLVSLYYKFTSRNIAIELAQKIKQKMTQHKKVTYIFVVIFLCMITLFILDVSSKDFELVSADVQITENPSTGIAGHAKEGEKPVLPDQYLEYNFVIKNQKNKQYGDSRQFVQLDFVPSKETKLLFGEEVFNNHRGYSGPGYFEANGTREFSIVFGIDGTYHSDINALEERALKGEILLSVNRKVIAKFKLK